MIQMNELFCKSQVIIERRDNLTRYLISIKVLIMIVTSN